MKQVAPVRKWKKEWIMVGKMKLERWCPANGSVVLERIQAAAARNHVATATTAVTAVMNTRKGTRINRLAEAEFLESGTNSPAGGSPAVSAHPTPEVSPKPSPPDGGGAAAAPAVDTVGAVAE